jgi:pyruvate dehydrogenase E1 component beta subunit
MKKENKSRHITYCEALNEAMTQEMARDKDVFVYGVGVFDHRGIFGSTLGLEKKFGKNRCFDTPISEDAMTGVGLGAAISGLRPIHTHMRVDFALLAMNQIANTISSFRYGSGGAMKVPMVIRTVIGRGWGQGFQHSKSIQSMFAHIPGLKVIMPTTPYDAKGMLIAAIRDDNPVVVIEHRWLYWQTGSVPSGSYEIPFGAGSVVRRGKDVTVVATSWMNVEAAHAARIMARRGIEVEIVDPRSIYPLDGKIITDSVRKTGHCVVADNDWVYCGFSAEVAALVSQKCFGALKSPVERIGFAPSPCPTVRLLEDEFYPNAGDIVRAIERQLKLPRADLSKEVFYSYENKFKGPF